MTLLPRRMLEGEIPAVARVWHEAWHEAHGAIVPRDLVRMRTVESFACRLSGFGDALRVAGPEGAPLGLCVAWNGEIDQLFVSREARGTGLGRLLIRDGETRLRAEGVARATLVCARSNHPARRFYEHLGWETLEEGPRPVETVAGPFLLPSAVYGKRLT